MSVRERDETGQETMNDYDAVMSAKELSARLREAFLELGDQKSADVFK